MLQTSLFPETDGVKKNIVTNFTLRYAKAWVKAGHEVVVLYHKSVYPPILTALFRIAAKISGHGGLTAFLEQYTVSPDNTYHDGGVTVIRKSVTKIFPKTLFPRGVIRREAKRCSALLRERGFCPDAVIADFINPALFVAREMDFGKNVPVLAGLHNVDFLYMDRTITKKRTRRALFSDEAALFHSMGRLKAFDRDYFPMPRKIPMLSGAPDAFLTGNEPPVFRKEIRNFVFAGRFYRPKHPDKVISAFGKLSDIPGLTLTLIGGGYMKDELIKLAAAQKNAAKIRFLGELSHSEVFSELRKADCLALISRPETFGMVYTEAMAAGCVPIGSRGEGIDGVIVDGENGFLCESASADALCEIFKKLIKAPQKRIESLSRAAVQTASRMTDSRLAKEVADALENEIRLIGGRQ